MSSERPSKRQRLIPSGADESDDFSDVHSTFSNEEVDISAVLAGKKSRREYRHITSKEEDDDDDLEDIIRESIAKRDVKGGTELLKKTKGKAKIVKGEVGGGSFQSMGMFYTIILSS